jgi:endonuclease-3
MVEKENKKRMRGILATLKRFYPNARCALNFKTPLQLLIATILSAQCTDERVNKVTEQLFKKYKKASDFANADISELENDIRSTGFFHNKANHIKASCSLIFTKYKHVPKTMGEMLTLPGVARKTANIVLGNAYGIIEGIAVDTHVTRLSQRLGVTQNKNPEKIERNLMEIVPRKEWLSFTHLLQYHGRQICHVEKPLCLQCGINKMCPSRDLYVS